MKKILTAFVLVIVAGMIVPATANPENQPVAVASNTKQIFVEIEGAIATNNNVNQLLNNYGEQSNWALGVGIGGNAQATSLNNGAASSGATAGVLAANDSMGNAEAYAENNLAFLNQSSYAQAYGGNPEGFSGDVVQYNSVYQYADSYIYNDQELYQYVYIDEYQEAWAGAPGSQEIIDSMFNEDDWNKTVSTYIY